MSHPELTPDEISELFALDKGIAALCGRLLSELKEGRDGAEVASVVLANSSKSEGQGLLHALVQQHMSIVLRACARHELADAWQEQALELFAKYKAFVDRASLLAHALADRWFDAKRYSKAEAWALRSIAEGERTGLDLPWLADAWRIAAQALSDDHLGPEVEVRLRKSLSLWKLQRKPDSVRGMFAHMGLGMYLLEVGKLKEADEAFVEAIVFANKLPSKYHKLVDAPVTQLMKLRKIDPDTGLPS
jgi:tetratricopeptide (TPR) repeat protein